MVTSASRSEPVSIPELLQGKKPCRDNHDAGGDDVRLTEALVEPLDRTPGWDRGEPPETFPFGL